MRKSLQIKLPSTTGAIIFSLACVMCFRLLVNMPIPYAMLHEIAFLTLGILYAFKKIFIATINSINHKSRLTLIEIYIFALIILLPLYSAWRANTVFGQPLFFGILTQRSIWLTGVVLIVIEWNRRRVITPEIILKTLLILAWLWLAYCLFMNLLIDPANLIDTYPIIVGGGEWGGYVYKIEPVLIVFGFFYYFFQAIRTMAVKQLLLAFPFISYLIIIFDSRSMTVSVMLSTIITASIFYRKKESLNFIITIAFIALIGFVLLTALFPEQITSLFQHYKDSFFVVLSGSEGEDVSSNMRIHETLIAIPFIEKNWLLGNGDLSSQWNDGYNSVLGYFYPADIGVFGSLFVFGILGLLFFYMQYLFLWNRIKTINDSPYRNLIISCYSVSFCLLIQSAFKGDLTFTPALSIFFIGIIKCITDSTHMNRSFTKQSLIKRLKT